MVVVLLCAVSGWCGCSVPVLWCCRSGIVALLLWCLLGVLLLLISGRLLGSVTVVATLRLLLIAYKPNQFSEFNGPTNNRHGFLENNKNIIE